MAQHCRAPLPVVVDEPLAPNPPAGPTHDQPPEPLLRPVIDARWVHQAEAEVRMDDLVWDLEMAYGQIRPVDRARLKTIKESFMRSPPLQLLHSLVVSKGHESMLLLASAHAHPFHPPQTPSL